MNTVLSLQLIFNGGTSSVIGVVGQFLAPSSWCICCPYINKLFFYVENVRGTVSTSAPGVGLIFCYMKQSILRDAAAKSKLNGDLATWRVTFVWTFLCSTVSSSIDVTIQ